MILGEDVPILTELLQGNVSTATGYVVTRAQTKEKSDQKMWSELPFTSGSRGKANKTKAERCRAKGSLSTPPLEDNEIMVAAFGKLQHEDLTLSSCFTSAKTLDKARKIIKEGDICFLLEEGRLYRLSTDKEQLVVPVVLHLGHSIPWSGHLGQEKTEQRILNRFF